MDSPILYDDTIIYLVEVSGSGAAKGAMGVFLERRTAEAWVRSLGGEVQNKISQTHLLDHRRHYNMSVAAPDLTVALPERPLPPPNFGKALPPPGNFPGAR
jgi:hypothetical protein